jgi:hypothetical protein
MAYSKTKTNSESSSSSSSLPTIPGFPAIPSIAGLTGSVSSNVSESELAKEAEKAINNASNQEMAKWTLMIIGIFTLFQAFANAFFTMTLLVLPVLYMYLCHTCPTKESFDARKELKRVLRGHHLADDHPDKPKGYIESMMARAAATVTAESAMLIDSKLELTSYRGAFILVQMKLPTQQMTVYWLGIAGEWRHIYASQEGEKK